MKAMDVTKEGQRARSRERPSAQVRRVPAVCSLALMSVEPSEKTPHSRIRNFLQGLPAPLRSPHILADHRAEDGRKTLVQRSASVS